MEDFAQLMQMLPSLGIDTEHVLAWFAVVMTALAVVGWGLDLVLPRLRAHALKTETKVDDGVVSWLEKVAAVLALINAIIPRPAFGGRGRAERSEDDEPKPPTDLGPTAVLFAFVVGGAAMVQGCGVSQWDVHAAASRTSNTTAQTGRAIIMGERRRVLLAAGQGAEDIAAAVTAAAERWDADNRVLIEAYNVFASAANQYAASAFAALRGEADDLDHLRVLAGRVADAWNAVAAIIDSASDTSLPRIPDWLLRFLRGDPSAQPTAGGAS